MQNSISANTLATYNNSISNFDSFRKKADLQQAWPAQTAHVILFIANAFESGLAPRTIRTYIAGINYYHKLHGWENLSEHFVIKKILEGFSRTGSGLDDRRPVTYNVLAKLASQLAIICKNNYETVLFHALWVFAYFGLFRVSELVATPNLQARQLFVHNVLVDKEHKFVKIVLNKHKTNQLDTPVVMKIPAEPAANLCPVQALVAYLSYRPCVPGPLFIHANCLPVTRYQFAAVLNKCVILSGLKESKIRTHSFRMGRATDLAAKGTPPEAIMKMGRWVSNAYRSYIR